MKTKDLTVSTARVIATMLVLIGHCLMYYGPYGVGHPDTSFTIAVEYIRKYIYSFHMAFFMMISGYVFEMVYMPKINNLKTRDFILNRLKRLIIPFIFIKFCMLNPMNVFLGEYKWQSMDTLFWLGHVWYLVDLFVITIFMFIAIKACSILWDDTRKTSNLLIIFFVVISLMSNYLPSLGKDSVTGIYYYSAFFAIGTLLFKQAVFKKMNLYAYVLSIFAGVAIFAASMYLSYENIIMKFVSALTGSFGWFGVCDEIKNFSKSKFFNFNEKYSMAIYLFHIPIIHLLQTTDITKLPPVLSMLFMGVISYSISVFFGVLLKRVKLQVFIGG